MMWVPGTEVECVMLPTSADLLVYDGLGMPPIALGTRATVVRTYIDDIGQPCIELVEIKVPVGYDLLAKAWRPITKHTTNISIFTAMLTDTKVKEPQDA